MENKKEFAHPFVKWVGGKTQLLPEIKQKYPQHIEKYCEPFVGGGAVLFDVLQSLTPKEVLINDINSELINTYIQIKENSLGLIEKLKTLENDYLNTPTDERISFYLTQREQFNNYITNNNSSENLNKAALFIFLNKTCFNGLYRVNSKGLFNVPFNKAVNPLICDEKNILNCSKLLQNVKMTVGDYSNCESFIDSNTFVYLDPPYRPLSETSSFTSYSKSNFSDKEQIELGNFIERISKKGAFILASNSDPKNSDKNDNFFDDLYSAFTIKRVFASRMINSNAKKRGAISEILISNMA